MTLTITIFLVGVAAGQCRRLTAVVVTVAASIVIADIALGSTVGFIGAMGMLLVLSG